MKKYMTMEDFLKTQTTNKDKKKRKNIFDHLIAIGCFSIIVFSLYTIFNWCKDNSKIKQLNKNIQQSVDILEVMDKGETINPPVDMNSNYYYYIKLPFIDVNCDTLLKENKDTIGYIHINNTNVSYPILQTDNNIYYLNHSFDKKRNKAGRIYLDYKNDINNLSDNTVIYGHARFDGTMFGSLKNVLSDYWLKNKDNYVIYISTFKENMLFQIFSIYTVEKENYYIKTSFDSDNEKREWLDTMKERNIAPISTEVNIDDKILTLSTCQNNHGGRIVIQAKLIKRQKK